VERSYLVNSPFVYGKPTFYLITREVFLAILMEEMKETLIPFNKEYGGNDVFVE